MKTINKEHQETAVGVDLKSLQTKALAHYDRMIDYCKKQHAEGVPFTKILAIKFRMEQDIGENWSEDHCPYCSVFEKYIQDEYEHYIQDEYEHEEHAMCFSDYHKQLCPNGYSQNCCDGYWQRIQHATSWIELILRLNSVREYIEKKGLQVITSE